MMSRLGIFAGAMLLGLASMTGCSGDDDGESNSNNSSSGGGETASSSGEVSSSGGQQSSSGGSSSGEVNAACAPPETYPGAAEFANSASVGLAIRGKLQELNRQMTALENANAGGDVTIANLRALYTAGMPSLAMLATPERVATVNATIAAFHTALGNNFNPQADDDGRQAGRFGKWIFDENGVDLRQIVEKGSFAGELYRIFSPADSRPWNGEKVDQAVALFGTTGAFSLDESDDDQAARPVHTARYSKNRAPAIFERFKVAAITAKHITTMENSAECSDELTAALAEMKLAWEESLAATVIYYLNRTAGEIAADGTDDNGVPKRANGLHGLGEVAGFFGGLRSIPDTERKATDAQLDAVLTDLKIIGNDGHVVDWAKGVGNAEQTFQETISKIADIYGFTAEQVSSFKR